MRTAPRPAADHHHPPTGDEALLARVLADALRGQLRLGLADVPLVAAAARRVSADRVAVVTLERWLATDPRAAALIRALAARS
jgi:hypothetical protein